MIQLFQHLHDGVERKHALVIAADAGRRAVDTVREWERDFIARGRVKIPDMGRLKREFLLRLDEGVAKKAKDWIRENCGILSGEANKTAEDFRGWMNKEIMPMLQAMETKDVNPFNGLRATLEKEKDNANKFEELCPRAVPPSHP